MVTGRDTVNKNSTLIYLSLVCFSNYSYVLTSTTYVYYESINWFYYSSHIIWTTCSVIFITSIQ